ncbi:unnamed protein product [Symbiodinium sp. CCMP2456]|nr:unnamed protein product [Symbiodinium sp. CCMP2456]
MVKKSTQLQDVVPFFLLSLNFCMGPEQSPDRDAKVLLKSKMRQRRQQASLDMVDPRSGRPPSGRTLADKSASRGVTWVWSLALLCRSGLPASPQSPPKKGKREKKEIHEKSKKKVQVEELSKKADKAEAIKEVPEAKPRKKGLFKEKPKKIEESKKDADDWELLDDEELLRREQSRPSDAKKAPKEAPKKKEPKPQSPKQKEAKDNKEKRKKWARLVFAQLT